MSDIDQETVEALTRIIHEIRDELAPINATDEEIALAFIRRGVGIVREEAP